jgi:hypothetical protein
MTEPIFRLQDAVKSCLLTIIVFSALVGCRSVAPPVSTQIAEDPSPIVADSLRASLVAAGRQVLAIALADVRDTAPVCVAFTEEYRPYRASPSELRELSDGHRRVIARTACPRTYVTMIYTGDAAPPGYVDPRYLNLIIPGAKAQDHDVIEVRVLQGTVTDIYNCAVPPTAQDGAPVCHLVGTWIS